MPRKRKPPSEQRGAIRVRAKYGGPWTGAFKMGYGFWHIQWAFPNPHGRQPAFPLNLGMSCVHELDVWVPAPDGATGYRLWPTPDGMTADDVCELPPESHRDAKKPPSAPLTEPLAG